MNGNVYQLLPIHRMLDPRYRLADIVGVVGVGPDSGEFDYHLVTWVNGQRDPALAWLEEELSTYRDRAGEEGREYARGRFLALAGRREGAAFFGEPTTARASSVGEAVKEAFARLVGGRIKSAR